MIKHLTILLLLTSGHTHATPNLAEVYGTTWHRNLHRPRRDGAIGGEVQTSLLTITNSYSRTSMAPVLSTSYYQNLDYLLSGLYSQATLEIYRSRYPVRWGVGELDLQLGKDFYRTNSSHAGVNIGGTIPGHYSPWAFGFGATATATPWSNGRHELQAIFAANYRYQFGVHDWRRVGVKNCYDARDYCIGTIGQPGMHRASDILCARVDVQPGDYVDALLGLSYSYGNWTLDAGYELFAQAAEEVSLKKDSWSDDTYGFVSKAYYENRMHLPFRRTDIAGVDHVGQYINRCDLNTRYGETQSYAIHTMYAGLGYIFNNWRYPLLLKLGGTRRIAAYRAPSRFSIFSTIALSF